MKTVAANDPVEQAVADLGYAAYTLLERVHRMEVPSPGHEAALHLRRLREFARLQGCDLDGSASYQANITSWRAIARLAGSVIETTRAG